MTDKINLSDYSDDELKLELIDRGYTVVDPLTPLELSPPQFEAVDWPDPPPFGIEQSAQ